MKSTLLITFLLFLNSAIFAQNEILTNQSILDMVELGFSEEVIIAKINNTDADFDTSINALKELKEKGLSDNVITTILNYSKPATNNDGDDKEEIKDTRIGIFINENGELKKILPTVFSGTKTNTLGSALSYGLASSSIKTVLNNSTSLNIVSSNKPEFIFFFVQPNGRLHNNGNNWWFFSATSPNEFALVKLDKKGKTREMQTGSVNIYSGTNIGVDEKNIIPFDIVSIDDYTYKVIPSSPLESGEYCFFYQGVIPQGGYNKQSVFDFSIQSDIPKPKYTVKKAVWAMIDNKPKHCDITNVELKNDGYHYVLLPYLWGKEVTVPESQCYPSKKKLLESLSGTDK